MLLLFFFAYLEAAHIQPWISRYCVESPAEKLVQGSTCKETPAEKHLQRLFGREADAEKLL